MYGIFSVLLLFLTGICIAWNKSSVEETDKIDKNSKKGSYKREAKDKMFTIIDKKSSNFLKYNSIEDKLEKDLNPISNNGIRYSVHITYFKSVVGILGILVLIFFLFSDFSRIPYCYPWTGKVNCEYDRAKYDRYISQEKYQQAELKLKDIESLLQSFRINHELLSNQSERDRFLEKILRKYPEASQYINDTALSYFELRDVVYKLDTLAVHAVAQAASENVAVLEKTEEPVIIGISQEINPEKLNDFLSKSSFPQLRELAKH